MRQGNKNLMNKTINYEATNANRDGKLMDQVSLMNSTQVSRH